MQPELNARSIVMVGVRDFRRLEDYKQWLRMHVLFDRYPIDDILRAGCSHIDGIAANVSGGVYEDAIREWRRALSDGTGETARRIALDPGPHGIFMRQINPFQGVMSEKDRLDVIRRARREQRAVQKTVGGERANRP